MDMSSRLLGCLLAATLLSCSTSALHAPDVGLPSRAGPVDLSRVTLEFRRQGGNAFIRLTGLPNSLVLAVLAGRGLQPPRPLPGWPAFPGIVTWDSLRLRVAWGYVPQNGVDRIAALAFVIAIEPSADQIGNTVGSRTIP